MFARIGEHPASLLIVLLIIVILFGWKRLPDAARSVGRSMRIFKSEVSEMKNDGKSETVQGETMNEQQAAAAEARRKAAEARAAAERAEREAAEAERNANGSSRL